MITNESTYQQILPSSSSHGVLYGLPKVRNKGCPSSQPGDDVLLSRLRGTQLRFPPKCIANTIQAIQSIFRALEINSKRCNDFFFVRSSQGKLNLFELQGPQYYFLENFRPNFMFQESDNFSDPDLHRIFQSENVRFPFSTKNSLTWGLNSNKLKFRKSQGI